MTTLEQQTKEADANLLNQYKKELNDLENGTGLAVIMCVEEIKKAKMRLHESINDYKGYLY